MPRLAWSHELGEQGVAHPVGGTLEASERPPAQVRRAVLRALQASESQIDRYLDSAQDAATSSNAEIVTRLTEVGTAVSNLVAELFLVLFGSYFFLADGGRIWSWVVRLFPRAARARVDSSGRIAWTSLTAFVRATVLVAMVAVPLVAAGNAVVLHLADAARTEREADDELLGDST